MGYFFPELVLASKDPLLVELPLFTEVVAFLEELLVGGCLDGFICESMQKNAHKLKEYIEFSSIYSILCLY